jgi:hypothetical protein
MQELMPAPQKEVLPASSIISKVVFGHKFKASNKQKCKLVMTATTPPPLLAPANPYAHLLLPGCCMMERHNQAVAQQLERNKQLAMSLQAELDKMGREVKQLQLLNQLDPSGSVSAGPSARPACCKTSPNNPPPVTRQRVNSRGSLAHPQADVPVPSPSL